MRIQYSGSGERDVGWLARILTRQRRSQRSTQVAVTMLLIVLTTIGVPVASKSTHSNVNNNMVYEAATVNRPANYGNLPLTFVPNAGQLDSPVRFSAQAGGATFFFTQKAVVFSFKTNESKGFAVRLSFLGANPLAEPTGVETRTGKFNYLIGNDPNKWRTGLQTFGEVVYPNLWPGIDLKFQGENGELKYEFYIAPDADYRRIQLAYEGVERLSLDRNGDLQIHTAHGVLRDSKPFSYQEVSGKRVPVHSHYSLTARSYGIVVGDYDRSRTLVIDPSLAYSTFLGGNQIDTGLGIAVDASGSAYITGETGASNFPTTVGAFDTTFNGFTTVGRGDVFVTKLNPSGTAVEYSTYIGGAGNDLGEAIAIDADGNAYITGSTTSTDFPTTTGAFDTTDNTGTDAFVAKLNPSGTALVYSTYLGGNLTGVSGGGAADSGAGIAVDAEGNTYVAGSTDSRDFPTTTGAFDTSYTSGAGSHVFVTKMNASGSSLVYSTYLGGGTGENAAGIVIDSSRNAFITGTTRSASFPTTAGAFDTTPFVGTLEVFVTKLNADGNGLIYSTFLGGGASDQGTGIAIDGAGNAYITGWGNSLNFPTTPGAFDTTGDSAEAFITKLNTDGSGLVYSTYLGGSQSENCWAIAVDSTGHAFVTGTTGSADYPTTDGAFDRSLDGAIDVFLTKLNATGSAIQYSTLVGGAGNEVARAVASDSSSSVYVTGNTSSNLFPTTPGAFQPVIGGGLGGDAFVLKLGNQAPSAEGDTSSTDEDNAVTINLLANDTEGDGDPLVIAEVTQGANGSVTINPDNTVEYSPAPDFNGSDSFTYVVVDTWGDTATSTVNVTVNPVNDAPIAIDVSSTTDEDQSVQVNFLATDVDSTDLMFVVVDGPTNGTLGAISNSAISYTPNANFNGSDSFTFKANDGSADSNVATVLVTITPVNDAPTANADSYRTNANTTLQVIAPGVLANDTDVDGDVLSAALETDVSHGTLALGSNGSFIYTPHLNFSGADSFSYRVFDGSAPSNIVTVDITINGQLAVFSSTRDGNAEIYSMGIDGSAQTRVTNHTAADVFPTWSPDRSHIAFSSNRDGTFEIFIMNADGSAPVRVTTSALVEGGFDWSPDGTKFVFTGESDGDPEIYVINVDGSGLLRLTKNRSIDTRPSWSPDGSKIAFASDRKRSFEIYVMNADGTGLVQLTKNSFADTAPDWSPDGTRLVFTSNRDGNLEIYSMNSDGTGVTRLTNNAAADDEPAWTSDGRIIFTSQRDGNAEIYLMNSDGSGQTRLTTNAAADTSPR